MLMTMKSNKQELAWERVDEVIATGVIEHLPWSLYSAHLETIEDIIEEGGEAAEIGGEG